MMLAATNSAVTRRSSAGLASAAARSAAVRCKSAAAAAAPASDNVKNFKIYRWDPHEKVRKSADVALHVPGSIQRV